jgi:WD40 repeat protein
MVAEIWLWQVGSWKAVGRLQAHSLTVTQMEFSRDDSMLLAVSRDRQFSVFAIKRTGTPYHEFICYSSVSSSLYLWIKLRLKHVLYGNGQKRFLLESE